MSAVVINGDTSGSITLQAPAVAGTNTLTLPASTGTLVTTGSPASGNVIQVVSTSSTTSTSTTGTAYVQWGTTLSITPKFSTSKILILHNSNFYTTATANSIYVTIYRNSTNLDLGNGRGFLEANPSASTGSATVVSYLDSPATTSSITYSIYFRNSANNGTLYYNADGSGGTITLMEIAA